MSESLFPVDPTTVADKLVRLGKHYAKIYEDYERTATAERERYEDRLRKYQDAPWYLRFFMSNPIFEDYIWYPFHPQERIGERLLRANQLLEAVRQLPAGEKALLTAEDLAFINQNITP